jgi:putative ABC transport system permease protein
MALGATSGSVGMLVLREGVRLLAGGLVLGVPLALALNRLLRGVLYGVAPTDVVALVVAPLLLASIGLLAALVPALRAGRVPPAITLRGD